MRENMFKTRLVRWNYDSPLKYAFCNNIIRSTPDVGGFYRKRKFLNRNIFDIFVYARNIKVGPLCVFVTSLYLNPRRMRQQ